MGVIGAEKYVEYNLEGNRVDTQKELPNKDFGKPSNFLIGFLSGMVFCFVLIIISIYL